MGKALYAVPMMVTMMVRDVSGPALQTALAAGFAGTLWTKIKKAKRALTSFLQRILSIDLLDYVPCSTIKLNHRHAMGYTGNLTEFGMQKIDPCIEVLHQIKHRTIRGY